MKRWRGRADGGFDFAECPAAPPEEQTTIEAAQFLHIFRKQNYSSAIFADCSKLLRLLK
jgi:hypothetical protein